MRQLLALDIKCFHKGYTFLDVNAYSYPVKLAGSHAEDRPIGSSIPVDAKETVITNRLDGRDTYYLNGCINGNAIHPFQIAIDYKGGEIIIGVDGLMPRDTLVLSTNEGNAVFKVFTLGKQLDLEEKNGFVIAVIPEYNL